MQAPSWCAVHTCTWNATAQTRRGTRHRYGPALRRRMQTMTGALPLFSMQTALPGSLMLATIPTGVLCGCTASWVGCACALYKATLAHRAWCSCRCVEEVIRGVISQACEVMIASHNQACCLACHSRLNVCNSAKASYRFSCGQPFWRKHIHETSCMERASNTSSLLVLTGQAVSV